MRMPFIKVYRAFDALDGLPDADCESLVRNVWSRRPWLLNGPRALTWALAVAWPLAWVLAASVWPIERWVPLPASDAARGILLLVTTVAVARLSGIAMRDVLLWEALRREVRGAACPKCKSSLTGLPLQHRAIGPPVPGDAFVRCPECGKKWVLLDIGLTPRDLVPIEDRAVRQDVGTLRGGRGAWAGRR